MARWKWVLAIVGAVGACSACCCLSSFIAVGVVATLDSREKRRMIAEADVLWDAGKKADAVAVYKPILKDYPGYIELENRPRLFARVVEHEFANRDFDSVRQFVRIAHENDVNVSAQDAKGNVKVALLFASKELHVLPVEVKDRLTAKDTPCSHALGWAPQNRFTEGNPSKAYDLLLRKGEAVLITMKSPDVDSFVIVENAEGKVLEYNDDDPNAKINTTLDAWLRFTAPDDGYYRVTATCLTGFRQRKEGPFDLSITKAK